MKLTPKRFENPCLNCPRSLSCSSLLYPFFWFFFLDYRIISFGLGILLSDLLKLCFWKLVLSMGNFVHPESAEHQHTHIFCIKRLPGWMVWYGLLDCSIPCLTQFTMNKMFRCGSIILSRECYHHHLLGSPSAYLLITQFSLIYDFIYRRKRQLRWCKSYRLALLCLEIVYQKISGLQNRHGKYATGANEDIYKQNNSSLKVSSNRFLATFLPKFIIRVLFLTKFWMSLFRRRTRPDSHNRVSSLFHAQLPSQPMLLWTFHSRHPSPNMDPIG